MVNNEEKKKKESITITEAKCEYEKLMEEVKPFIKRKNIKQFSTASEWYETSSTYK